MLRRSEGGEGVGLREKEHLGDVDAADGGVVERALEPLAGLYRGLTCLLAMSGKGDLRRSRRSWC